VIRQTAAAAEESQPLLDLLEVAFEQRSAGGRITDHLANSKAPQRKRKSGRPEGAGAA
jgi:hypothetical protein